MAATSRSTRTSELQMPRRWKERETSPERTKVWTEPSRNKIGSSDRRVPVIYYLSRNGQLEHPHFMEVPLSSPDGGLYLRDVINRLNFLRGKGMASLYSWSSKRSYKNGYVWHDLSENDFIYPAHGHEYILKGSELLEGGTISKSDETVMYTSMIKPPPETRKHDDNHDFPGVTAPRRQLNRSWSSFDLHEYKVYSGESTGRAAADASTQTDDKRRRRRVIREIEEVDEDREVNSKEQYGKEPEGNQSTELSTDEISPPPSDSSPETLETLLKADVTLIVQPETINEDPTPNNTNHLSGRGKASTVLMQLLSCGSMGFKDCGPGQGKDNGFSLVSHYKVRMPRGGGSNQVEKDTEDDTVSSLASGFGGRVKLEDKEYFSGSLIETKKDEFPALKRSSSYNEHRSSQLELGVKEMEESRAKCIPRKPKSSSTKKKSKNDLSCSSGSSSIMSSSSQHGSKRIVVQP